MSGDPLSDILRLTVAASVISGGLSAGGTWAFRFRAHDKIKFYTVVDGACWLRVERGRSKPIRVAKGDIFLLHGPRSFVLASNLTTPARDACPVFDDQRGELATVGDGAACALLVGVVALEPSTASLLTDALPELIHIQGDAPDAAALRWLVERIEYERTARRLGAGIANAQLAQLIFVQVLRTHLLHSQAVPRGWLRAIADERISRAIHLMHAEPARAWRLAELAHAAGMSRAAFAVRFKALAGVAPFTYLTAWRIRLAQRRLREEDVAIADISAALGYASESAFSHAFKRVTGIAPRPYRQMAKAPAAPAQRDRARLHA